MDVIKWKLADYEAGLCDHDQVGLPRSEPAPEPETPVWTGPQFLDTPEKIIAFATPEAVKALLYKVLAAGAAADAEAPPVAAPAPPPKPAPVPPAPPPPPPAPIRSWFDRNPTPTAKPAEKPSEPPPQQIQPRFWDSPNKPAEGDVRPIDPKNWH